MLISITYSINTEYNIFKKFRTRRERKSSRIYKHHSRDTMLTVITNTQFQLDATENICILVKSPMYPFFIIIRFGNKNSEYLLKQ